MSLRIVFMGTPDFAVPTLEKLAGCGHEIVGVYSQPPRPAGRGMEPRKSPVHRAAEQLGIEVYTPLNFKEARDQSTFAALQPDVAIVVAYGLLLPKAVLDTPKYGCFNGHASLLPRWRGAAPIQRAIMAGDKQTGVMIMKMEEGLDTGPVAKTATVDIARSMTAGTLHDELATACAVLMVKAMDQLESGALKLIPQSETGVTYAKKIDKSETRIQWDRPANEVHNHIRGLSPFPGAWCELELSGKLTRVKILQSSLAAKSGKPGEVLDARFTIACGNQSVAIERLQKAGKQPVTSEEFLRGNPLSVGTMID